MIPFTEYLTNLLGEPRTEFRGIPQDPTWNVIGSKCKVTCDIDSSEAVISVISADGETIDLCHMKKPDSIWFLRCIYYLNGLDQEGSVYKFESKHYILYDRYTYEEGKAYPIDIFRGGINITALLATANSKVIAMGTVKGVGSVKTLLEKFKNEQSKTNSENSNS